MLLASFLFSENLIGVKSLWPVYQWWCVLTCCDHWPLVTSRADLFLLLSIFFISHQLWSFKENSTIIWVLNKTKLASIGQRVDPWFRFRVLGGQGVGQQGPRGSRSMLSGSQGFKDFEHLGQDFEVEVPARFWSWRLVSILLQMFGWGYEVESWSIVWS